VELIYEQRLFPEVSYAFKHALTHEVAYASIPAPERRALHRRIAQALEALYGDRLGEVAGALARHYSAAEDWERALGYLVRAAEAAARAFATREALALYDEALAAATHLPGGDPARVMTIHQARSARSAFSSRAIPTRPGGPPPGRQSGSHSSRAGRRV